MRFVSALLHIAAGLNLLLHLPAAEDAFYYGFRFRAGGAARRKQYALYSQTSLHQHSHLTHFLQMALYGKWKTGMDRHRMTPVPVRSRFGIFCPFAGIPNDFLQRLLMWEKVCGEDNIPPPRTVQ